MRDAMTQARLAWLGRNRAPDLVQNGCTDNSEAKADFPPSWEVPRRRLRRVLAFIRQEAGSIQEEAALIKGLDMGLTLAFGPHAVREVGRTPCEFSLDLKSDLSHRLQSFLLKFEGELQQLFVLRGFVIGILMSHPSEQVTIATYWNASLYPVFAENARRIIENL